MNQYSLLKNTFLINGFLSAVTGLICLFLSDNLSTLFGNISSLYLEVIGGGLVVFGGFVFFFGKKEKPNLIISRIIFYLDVVWVLGTTGLLALFSESIHIRGFAFATAVGLAVLGFAIFEFKGIKKIET
ncbi:MAG: hypothetical protein IBJ01_02275 [Leptospira sp.]|uniref:Uncharacterized protein n=2 Tax=Leptospira TaxID=171 RepID=A0ABT3M872_9LEPT|nr:hypothetical protein [Leptospira paudalimensis]MBL0953574.1 hypothetical protein [Leptospira sp.]MCW7504579.1 hypothetical protein [Leptospira paudalimensis]